MQLKTILNSKHIELQIELQSPDMDFHILTDL